MSDEALSDPVVLNRADGTRREFKRCAPEDRLLFRAIFKEYRRVGLKSCLDIEGVPLKDRVPFYTALENNRFFESDAVQWLNEMEGQHEAILLSLRRENTAATMQDVHALNLDKDELLFVAAGVLNVPLVSEKNGGQDRPLSGTATGGATEISSDASAATPNPSPSPLTSSTAA